MLLFRKPVPPPSLLRSLTQLQYKHSIASSRSISMASTLPRLPIFEAIAKHDPQSTVVVHSKSGRKFTYGELLSDVAAAKSKLVKQSGHGGQIEGQRIAFLVENSYDYVGAQNSKLYTSLRRIKLMQNSNSPFHPWCTLDCATSQPCISGARVKIHLESEPGHDAIVFSEIRK